MLLPKRAKLAVYPLFTVIMLSYANRLQVVSRLLFIKQMEEGYQSTYLTLVNKILLLCFPQCQTLVVRSAEQEVKGQGQNCYLKAFIALLFKGFYLATSTVQDKKRKDNGASCFNKHCAGLMSCYTHYHEKYTIHKRPTKA